MSSIVMEEFELLGDSKYRSYMSLLDKALKAFEYTTEWADLIAALGKLNKVLAAHMKYPIIPRRIVISKRLAQCMHPALPSGVHLKALETYDIIFKCMGTNRLAQELFLYSAGLFPLLGHAAMNVRPSLLTVYETHFVPMGDRLRPALNGLLSGILPGMEEGSDHYDRTNRLLESICEASHPSIFYSAMWECMATNASIRLPAITFILSHSDRRASVKDQTELLGKDQEILVHAVCMAVQDTSVLVQRNALDLLIAMFPLHETTLQESELVSVVAAAVSVLLRRDMSLNRRLFNWLLGCDGAIKDRVPRPKDDEERRRSGHVRQESTSSNGSVEQAGLSYYFEYYSKSILEDALKIVLARSLSNNPSDEGATNLPDLRPYRLLTTMLDKPEIGPLVIDDVILDVFRTMYHSYHSKLVTTTGRQDLIKSTNLLFSTLESNYIWESCGRMFDSASRAEERLNDLEAVNTVGTDGTTIVEMCAIIDFLLDIVSIETYVETHSEHLPELFKEVVGVTAGACKGMTTREITSALRLARRILAKVQPAWNAWDAQEENREKANVCEDVTVSQVEEAKEMWSQMGEREVVSVHSSPELGKEATETHQSQHQFDETIKSNKLLQQQHDRLIADCSDLFQSLFESIMVHKVFAENFKPGMALSKTVHRPNDTLEERTKYLECLLEERVGNSNSSELAHSNAGTMEEEAALKTLCAEKLPLRSNLNNLEQALTTCCQIFVDLSSMPTMGKKGGEANSPSAPYGCEPSRLPHWLQYLLVCSCFLDTDHSGLQLQCISTLLDLISLLQSTLLVSEEGESGGGTRRDNNFVIVMMPLIKDSHFHCVMKQTIVPQVLATNLWNGLGVMAPMFHLKCVTLLHQLHNLAPTPTLVERTIARSLGYGPVEAAACNVDAYQRFTLLWHLSRELDAKGSRQKRTFDICLLKMLDNLNLSYGPLKALSQSWLVHAMAKGDIGRLMEPLFLTLLDPSTARVSVLHTKIEMVDVVGGENETGHRVYGISSSNQEVIYHVSANQLESSLALVNSLSSDRVKRLFALSKLKRPPSPTKSKQSVSLHESSLSSVSLSVNPFALVPKELQASNYFLKGYGEESSDDESDDSEEERSETISEERSVSAEIVESLVDQVVKAEEGNPDSLGSISSTKSAVEPVALSVHPLHSHLLLYSQVCDSRRILYTMQCVKNILHTNPRLAICTLSTTNLNAAASARNTQIQMLLARHRKSVFGKNFVGNLSSENMTTYRNSTLIEVLVSTLLYYLRSYYPNLGQVSLSREEIRSNREVQLMAIDILSVLVSELVMVVQDNGRAYATYISDLFSRCKVQKVVLHSLLACINDMRDMPKKKEEAETFAFTEDIMKFNEIQAPTTTTKGSHSEKISNYSEAFQVQVLRLLLSLVMLEQAVCQQKGEAPDKLKPLSSSEGKQQQQQQHVGPSNVLRYHSDHIIPDQPMFLAAIVSALRQEKMRHLHSHWTSLVTSCLPFLGRSLSQSVLEVTAQLSRNIEHLAGFYSKDRDDSKCLGQIPADYVVTQLEALTMIYHYCLLDSSSQVSATFTQPSTTSQSQSGSNNSEILTNLLHVFLSNTDTKSWSSNTVGPLTSADAMAIARKILVSTLPRLIKTVAILWKNLTSNNEDEREDEASSILVGSPKIVRARLLDLVSPIAHHHTDPFISAIALCWKDMTEEPKKENNNKHNPVPQFSADQAVLVELCASIRTLPVSTVLQTVRQIVKSPGVAAASAGGSKSQQGKNGTIEVAILQFFYAYLAQCTSSQIFESWSSLAALLKECLGLSPPAIFLALAIVNQFVQRSPTLGERKEQKELQDVSGKLIESCATIGGSCLEQTTWLRRNLAVNAELQANTNGETAPERPATPTSKSNAKDSAKDKNTLYAVPALTLLGDMLAAFLDIVYQSDEKEKVLPLLTTVMYNVMPYLRNHSRSNLPSFRACSKLLSSLSEYQYTRKAWKRESVDLLLDPAFFQMDQEGLQNWRQTVDNLLTHDKTTFKELMTKVSSISQSGSLSLFSSKEQELEQRSLLLKRLAFVIFCSETDQYHKQMPDIQERLAESLRTIPSSPSVQSAVFLCFRVILVRMSAQHVTSLWPIIITEMVQIFSYLEQELWADSEEWSSHLKRLSTLDTSWVVSAGSNGLAAHNSPQWMSLYLSVCKLLDLCLALPAAALPQFQMYRWAFVREGLDEENDYHDGVNGQEGMDFVPYVVRVAKLLLLKCKEEVMPATLTEGQPLLTMTSVTNLEDLAPFFASICQNVTKQQTKSHKKKANRKASGSGSDIINAIIERDFLENLSV